ncbi:MAG: polyhydroxyalkanoate synthesis repressor PhaR [Pseudomonadota bacterium]
MSRTDERKTLNISRYSSRRLYNTGAGEYVTVDDLARYIRDGHDIRVTDKKSGEDITSQILLQIIADQEAESGSVLPANILTDVVRSYTGDGKSLVPKFLSESFDVLKGHRQRVSDSLLDQLSNPLDPRKAINSFEALRDAQAEIAKSVLSAWLPASAKKKTDDLSAQPDTTQDRDKPESTAEGSDELAELKAQMRDMQEKLQRLEKG